jgi:hypothetical protein
MTRTAVMLVRACQVVFVLLSGGPLAAPRAWADDGNPVAPIPTIAVLESLAVEVAREMAPDLPGDSSAVMVSVESTESAWFVEGGLIDGLAPRPAVREPGGAAPLMMLVGIKSMGVAYENVRRDGLFGSRIVTRTAFLEADVSIIDRGTGAVLSRKPSLKSRMDHVEVDDLPRLEEPGLPWTTGKLPPEGFFSSVLEPVITVCAIGVAVILLFTVRS